MRMREFIMANRTEIDRLVMAQTHMVKLANDRERIEWVLNDEGLYNWVKSEGVKI